ncbi:RBBP8 N-terminal-like protein [Thomomys bottae]
MESFLESLNRLKDVHEKEVLGLQSKLLELNSERCREAQRVEELFAKNQQLREQQKVLKENLRALENRLRAGLCDRCKVTQELARKKQLELESAHLQSLQHLCVLTNEMNGLKEENKTLREEVKRLRSLEDRTVALTREGSADPPSPLLLPSPSSWKMGPEKAPGGLEETEEDYMDTEKPAGYRTSPGTKISPGANLPEPRPPDMVRSPQRISNQLHATVAVVRPGSRACSVDCGHTSATPPPTTSRSHPPSPVFEHSAPLDSFLQASRSCAAFESLKRSLQADRLCLLNRQRSLRLRGPHGSPLASTGAPHSPQPQGLKAQEPEAWEEPTGLLGLPSALVGMQDPRLEGALHLLLAQQHLWAQARTSRMRDPPTPGEAPASPPAGLGVGSPRNEALRAGVGTPGPPGGWHPQPTGPSSLQRKEGTAAQDYTADKPLDLSDPARSRDSKAPSQPKPRSPAAEPQGGAEPALCSPRALSNGIKGTTMTESEELFPTDASSPSGPASPHRLPLPSNMEESSQAKVQRPESDERDEPAPLDSQSTHSAQADASSEASTKPSVPGKGPLQDPQQKRKWALESGDEASKKPCRGKKPRDPLTAAEESESPPSPEDHSPAPGNNGWEI